MTDLPASAEDTRVASPLPVVLDFEAVYRAEFPYVHRVLRYLGVRDADLEDLAHDVFLVVHRRLVEFDMERPIRPWLFGISYHLVVRHRQRFSHRYEIATGEVPEQATPRAGVEDRVAAAQAWAVVCAAVQELPMDQRAVFVMHDIEGHSAPEIAAAVEAPLNTIYSRLRLARARFAGALDRRGMKGGRR